MSTRTEKIVITKSKGVAYIIINQPEKRNAISLEMWQRFRDAIDTLSNDDLVRVIVVRGEGDKAFSAGADISQFEDQRSTKSATGHYNDTVTSTLIALGQLEKPTIAMIRGFCVGGGTSVAIHCDLRIAADDALFAIPAVKLGLAYGWEDICSLVQLIGPAFTREVLYTGRLFTSSEALKMGLVNQVVATNDLESYVANYANTIADNAPLTVHAIKLAVREALKEPDRRNLSMVSQAIETCFNSLDYKEGRAAFLSKRKPRFKGQ